MIFSPTGIYVPFRRHSAGFHSALSDLVTDIRSALEKLTICQMSRLISPND